MHSQTEVIITKLHSRISKNQSLQFCNVVLNALQSCRHITSQSIQIYCNYFEVTWPTLLWQLTVVCIKMNRPELARKAAAVRNKLKENTDSTAGANAYGNHSQYKRIDTHQQHNALSWVYTIRDYVKNGFYDKALRLYYQMQRAGIQPGKLVFISVINACGGISGKKIHEDIIAGVPRFCQCMSNLGV